MASDDHLTGTSASGDEEAALAAALEEAPRGAVAVAGVAVGLLLLCWFAIYLFVFLPRGSVG